MNPAADRSPAPATLLPELRSGVAGMLISLAPALTMGLLAYAALGPRAAALGIPAALISSAVGGLVFALLARGPMPAGGPAAAPVLVLGGLVAGTVADPRFSADDPTHLGILLALTALAVVCMGLVQVALGLSGLVRFAKFVPQPVLAGFMNGVALLALMSLLPLLLGWPIDTLRAGARAPLPALQPWTLAVGLFTVAVILLLPRVHARLPATLIGLLVGTGLHALLAAVLDAALPAGEPSRLGPLTGPIPAVWPELLTLAPILQRLHDPLLQQHLPAALTAGMVMALIGTLDLVLNGLALDQARHTRTDPRSEVLALGAANVASGLTGGLPLLMLRPRALHMLQVGGRSKAGLYVCSGLFALLGLVATPLLALLPQVVLGGVMVTIAFLMADRWSLQLCQQWRHGPRSAELKLALAVTLVVCAVTLLLGFAAAVGLGALLSVLLFVRSMNRSLVRSRYSASEHPSRRIYAAADERQLHLLRRRITVLELEGAVFFGSADRLAELADEPGHLGDTLVLDFRRVTLIDASGAVVLAQLGRRLSDRGATLMLAGVWSDNRHAQVLQQFVGASFVREHAVVDIDQAVEAAELRLLQRAGFAPLSERVAVDQTDLMQGLDAAQRRRLAAAMPVRHLVDGEVLFRTGDTSDRLYVITAGSINVFGAASGPGRVQPQRYVGLSAGMMIGELAMIDGRGRSADAVAVGPTEVCTLDQRTLEAIGREDPALRAAIYRNIALHLSNRLRAAAWAWQASSS